MRASQPASPPPAWLLSAVTVLLTVLLVALLPLRLEEIPPPGEDRELPAQVTSAPMSFIATAYCKGTVTRSGVEVRSGIAAADPDLLPVGSVIDVIRMGEPYDGIYTVMDTGPAVRGHHIDVYMWSCYEALDFGLRDVGVTVLRLGWSPDGSDPQAIAEEIARRRRELPAKIRARPLVARQPRFLYGARAPTIP